MKKLLPILFSVTIFLLVPTQTLAVDKCCDPNFAYDSSKPTSSQCQTSGSSIVLPPNHTSCPAGTICTKLSVFNPRGTCADPTSSFNPCCPDGYSLVKDSNTCFSQSNPGNLIPSGCNSNETCTFNTCILEPPETPDKPTAINCDTNNDTCPTGCACYQNDPQTSAGICKDSNQQICTSDMFSATGPAKCRTDSAKDGILTAIGCLPIEIGAFTRTVLNRGISIGAGLAFLLMLYGAFVLITSAGNPENTKKGGEIITSAIVGLLFIIFSIFLLKVIGIDILNLSDFQAI